MPHTDPKACGNRAREPAGVPFTQQAWFSLAVDCVVERLKTLRRLRRLCSLNDWEAYVWRRAMEREKEKRRKILDCGEVRWKNRYSEYT